MISGLTSALSSPIGLTKAPGSLTGANTASFADALKSTTFAGMNNLKIAETTAITGLLGGSSINDVVHNVLAAERSLHTMIAVRDKIVSAYQEISRMQI